MATKKDRNYELAFNIAIYGVDKMSALPPRGNVFWPKAVESKKSIKVVRVRHEGNWNVEPLALKRLDVVSKVIGYKARLAVVPGVAGVGDPVAVYRERFEAEIRASIDAGKPCLLG